MADETFVIPVTVPSTVGQCDTANTDFDKSPRHQNQFVVRGGTIVLELERFTVAVSRADRRVFLGDVQSVHQFAGGQDVKGLRRVGVQSLQLSRRIHGSPQAIHA